MHDPGPLATAPAYVEIGLPIIPICGPRHGCGSPGKIPFDPLARRHLAGWQHRGIPDPDQVARWLEAPGVRGLNIGLVLGDGLVGLDVDGPEGETLLADRSQGDLPQTWAFTTARGRRLIYAAPTATRIGKANLRGSAPRGGLDILGEGTQTVVPPSVHHTGAVYRWAPQRDPWQAGPPALAPAWVTAEAHARTTPTDSQSWSHRGWWQPLLVGVSVGARHSTAARLVGRWVRLGLGPEEIALLAAAWNARNPEPLPVPELERIMADLVQLAPPSAISRRVVATG